MNRLFCSFLLLFVLQLSSCDVDSLPKEELIAYLMDEDNGLIKTEEQGDFKISLTYRPSDLVAEQELLITNNLDQRDSIRQHYKQYLYFVLAFSHDDKEIETRYAGNATKYNQVVKYLQSGIGSDVSMTIDGKQEELLDFIFTQTFGNAKSSKVLLVFPNKLNLDEQIKIKVNTNLLGLGIHYFFFESDDLMNTPQLKL